MIDNKFISIVRPYLKYLSKDAPLNLEDNLKDLGLDSMDSINLILEIEEVYGIEFSEEDLIAETFNTIGSIWGLVQKYLNS